MKKGLSIIIILLLCKLSFSQSPSTKFALPTITPPSPDAAALGRFGDIQVDKGTGTPEINVPVYTIQTSRFNLPISLSYNATGIKVDQIATWAGLGWSLNAGGVIDRTIVGNPDENINGDLDNMTFPDLSVFPAAYDIYDRFRHGKEDFDPDYYFFNFNGHAGKFAFGEDHKPLQITNSANKIQYNRSDNSFTVTDEKGDQYLFRDKERVSHEAYDSPVPRTISYGVTSWYLSEMVSADKSDTIRFKYKAEERSLHENSYSYSRTIGPSSSPNLGSTCGDGPDDTFEELGHTVRISSPLRISSITFNGGKINFLPKSNRLDEPTMTALSDIEVYNYNYVAKTYHKIKSFKFNHGYFFSDVVNKVNSDYTNLRYRLRLESMVGLDKNGTEIQRHSFSYNDMQPPPVNNFAQDVWGYYNGKTDNNTLLQKQTVIHPKLSKPYSIGDADRTVNEAYVQAGMLTSIRYPTKGYTQFNYESHRYIHNYESPERVSNSLTSGGMAQNGFQTLIITPSTPSGSYSVLATISASISRYGNLNPPVRDRPLVTIIDMSTGQTIYTDSGDPMKESYTQTQLTLICGRQYKLTASAIGNERVLATIGVEYEYMVNKVETRPGGGLRIASIKNFDPEGNVLSTDTYKYGITESGIGTTISPTFALKPNNQLKLFSVGRSGSGVLCYECITLRLICSSSSSYELSTLASSPIAYDAITQYHGNKEVNIGKTVSEYDLFTDASLPVLPSYQGGVMLTPNSWRNGQVKRESKYQNINGEYKLKHKKVTDFAPFIGAQAKGMKMGLIYIVSGCLNRNPNNYFYFDFPIFSGVKLPQKITETEYDLSGRMDSIQKSMNYYYDNLSHLQPTRIQTISSKGDTLKQYMSYPQDMVDKGNDPTGVYNTMSGLNILSPVIETVNLKNQTILNRVKTNYFNTNNIIVPKNVESQTGTYPSEIRLNYQSYDTKGNLLVVSQADGPLTAYQWGYNQQYPVAKAIGTSNQNIFYEGFEEEKGNSSYNDSKTGNYSYTGAYSKSLVNLSPGKYLLSYWLKSGDQWTCNTLPLTLTGSTYNISLNGQIDEIRLHPENVEMTTFTYNALTGVSSSTDAKGYTSYYEYDSFQRLMNVKDNNKNIIKNLNYNYKN